MPIDIVIFAVVAAVLIHKLNATLGTKHGDERPRTNPFADGPQVRGENGTAENNVVPMTDKNIVEDKAAPESPVQEGLATIAAEDPLFDVPDFKHGASIAFEMVVEAYAKGEPESFQPFVSENLYQDFVSGIKERDKKELTEEVEIHRVKEAEIIEARLNGVMAYVTVKFLAEETKTVKDKKGEVVEGDPDKISEIVDIWTFARDVRSADPNWLLIETRTADD